MRTAYMCNQFAPIRMRHVGTVDLPDDILYIPSVSCIFADKIEQYKYNEEVYVRFEGNGKHPPS